jgi:hypothetical protein
MRTLTRFEKYGNFKATWIHEFATVDQRLGRPSLNALRQTPNAWIPNYESQAMEVLYSGFLRAIHTARFNEDLYEYASPIAPSAWFAPSKRPAELDAIFSAHSIEDVVAACELIQSRGSWPGRVHARLRQDEDHYIDLQIAGFYHNPISYGVPDLEDVLSDLGQPQLRIDWTSFPTMLGSQRKAGWSSMHGGWLVVPATLCFSTDFAPRWQADLVLRDPSVPFALEPLSVRNSSNHDSLGFDTEQGNEIGRFAFWLTSPDLSRPGGVLAPNGTSCVLKWDFVSATAVKLHATPALIVKMTKHKRRSYDDDSESNEYRAIGVSQVMIG